MSVGVKYFGHANPETDPSAAPLGEYEWNAIPFDGQYAIDWQTGTIRSALYEGGSSTVRLRFDASTGALQYSASPSGDAGWRDVEGISLLRRTVVLAVRYDPETHQLQQKTTQAYLLAPVPEKEEDAPQWSMIDGGQAVKFSWQ